VKLGDVIRAARYDGLFWRRMAHLGSAYGPWWWRQYSPAAFGATFYAVLGPQRRAVRQNQRLMRPDRGRLATERATLDTFLAFARCLTDSLEVSGPTPPEFDVVVVGESNLEAAHHAGHGAVLATAHVGAWDLFGRLVAKKGYPITIAMARERNASVRSFVENIREDGPKILYTDDTAFAALDLLREVRAGRILAVQIDRPSGSGGDHVVPFFGVPVPFPIGPFLLAQAATAPILPILCLLTGHHRYRIEISDPIQVPRGHGRGTAEAALEAAVAIFESRLRDYPEQWFHFTPIGGEGFATTP
jgi:lauroyl/myristoyl acyltransferase